MKRVQRKRTGGWHMPDNTKYVGRPTKWGNPFKLDGDIIYVDASHRRKVVSRWVFFCYGDAEVVVKLYEAVLTGHIEPALAEYIVSNNGGSGSKGDFAYMGDLLTWKEHFSKLNMNELKGKNLACFCSLNAPCHADVLLEHAAKHNPLKVIEK